MRVKLSYTVEESDILPEAAKILGLSSDDMKQAIDLFQAIQSELATSNESPNTAKSLEMLDELRKALLAVDTRVMEVVDIIEGFEDYRLKQRAAEDATLTRRLDEAPSEK
jgi:hypothetical protein|tara:strand:- start:10445 stop:10774 length:330 start_codon:yes stop_codon:yes gene_type:complete